MYIVQTLRHLLDRIITRLTRQVPQVLGASLNPPSFQSAILYMRSNPEEGKEDCDDKSWEYGGEDYSDTEEEVELRGVISQTRVSIRPEAN